MECAVHLGAALSPGCGYVLYAFHRSSFRRNIHEGTNGVRGVDEASEELR